jgi:hypothetical protein
MATRQLEQSWSTCHDGGIVVEVSETGIAVDDVIKAIKNAIKLAGISATDPDRDLRVTSLQLVLNTVATTTGGGGMDFRLPFLGMKLKAGGAVTKRDTHTIDITLMPPDRQHEIRDSAIEPVLLDAVETIRAVVARAIGGDDPFFLKASTVELNFAVTREGWITLGLNGEFNDELTHTIRMGIGLQDALPS